MNKILNIFTRPFVPQLALIVIILLLAYYVFKKFLSPNTKADENYNSDIQTPALSYPSSQYYVLADQIQAATQSNNDDEELIYNVFRMMRTRSDVLKLILAFGNRSYWTGFSSGFAVNATLPEILHSELDSKELAAVNKIISENGINFSI